MVCYLFQVAVLRNWLHCSRRSMGMWDAKQSLQIINCRWKMFQLSCPARTVAFTELQLGFVCILLEIALMFFSRWRNLLHGWVDLRLLRLHAWRSLLGIWNPQMTMQFSLSNPPLEKVTWSKLMSTIGFWSLLQTVTGVLTNGAGVLPVLEFTCWAVATCMAVHVRRKLLAYRVVRLSYMPWFPLLQMDCFWNVVLSLWWRRRSSATCSQIRVQPGNWQCVLELERWSICVANCCGYRNMWKGMTSLWSRFLRSWTLQTLVQRFSVAREFAFLEMGLESVLMAVELAKMLWMICIPGQMGKMWWDLLEWWRKQFC